MPLQVERVFADRTRIENDEEVSEYLVKWKGLSYNESTWCDALPSSDHLLFVFKSFLCLMYGGMRALMYPRTAINLPRLSSL